MKYSLPLVDNWLRRTPGRCRDRGSRRPHTTREQGRTLVACRRRRGHRRCGCRRPRQPRSACPPCSQRVPPASSRGAQRGARRRDLGRHGLRACRPHLFLLLCSTDSNSAQTKKKSVNVDNHRRVVVVFDILQKAPYKKLKNGQFNAEPCVQSPYKKERHFQGLPCKKMSTKNSDS